MMKFSRKFLVYRFSPLICSLSRHGSNFHHTRFSTWPFLLINLYLYRISILFRLQELTYCSIVKCSNLGKFLHSY
jgi:hypothetical protein